MALRPSESAGLHKPPPGLKPVIAPPKDEDEIDVLVKELEGEEEDESAADGKKT